MSVITVDGDFIHYEVLGRGRPVLFLHGWIGSWRYWIPTMQSASISYRAYALDLWGFGDSSKRSNRYSLEQQVNLLEGFLENLGISKIGLVGHGLGAVIGLKFTAKNPAYVDRILLTAYPFNFPAIFPRFKNASINELADWLINRLPVVDSVRTEAFKADHNAISLSFDELSTVNSSIFYSTTATPSVLVYGRNDPVIKSPLKK
jgi:pimeloyl-ACP methyl ester carboxylesterase